MAHVLPGIPACFPGSPDNMPFMRCTFSSVCVCVYVGVYI